MAWRVDPSIAGGGLFHDLAPHQLDLAYYYFGEPIAVNGVTANQSKTYQASDIVSGNIIFKNDILFTGTWCFNVAATESKDSFEIFGSEGKISFCVFGKQNIILNKNGTETIIPFEAPMHVQQPMIEAVVKYFLGIGPNPCSANEGAIVMKMMDEMSAATN
jgi:predicted dehydrogenase